MILDEFGHSVPRDDESRTTLKTPDWLIREGLEALRDRVGLSDKLFGPTLYDADGHLIERPLAVTGKPFTSPLSIMRRREGRGVGAEALPDVSRLCGVRSGDQICARERDHVGPHWDTWPPRKANGVISGWDRDKE